jgi:hypothetical protein
MSPQNFCYWLRGLLELGKPESLDAEQIKIINKHLDLVFAPSPVRFDFSKTEYINVPIEPQQQNDLFVQFKHEASC